MNETPEEAGLRESWEEAGLRGKAAGLIGEYSETKKGETTDFRYYVMDVAEMAVEWGEMDQRKRILASVLEWLLHNNDHL